MYSTLKHALLAEINTGGQAYIRNLVAAEAAILQGQFNVAKVLRAAAHAQRATAMTAARLLVDELESTALFDTIRTELGRGADLDMGQAEDKAVRAKFEQMITVQEGLQQIIRRAISSLDANPDVLESDVPIFLWGCYGCGHIMEGDAPDVCPVCGALAVEFEWFGPFYGATAEHLGQLTPADMMDIIAVIPERVAGAIDNVDDATLRRQPSAEEWCIKEIVGHMIETHVLFQERVRFILESQSISALPRPVPPWKLHEGKGYEDLSADELVERLTQVCSASLALVRDLTPKQWARRGTIVGTANTILDLGTWLTNHDRGHLAQITAQARS
jgi:rubrerythrin